MVPWLFLYQRSYNEMQNQRQQHGIGLALADDGSCRADALLQERKVV
jgi:hypothetical protein